MSWLSGFSGASVLERNIYTRCIKLEPVTIPGRFGFLMLLNQQTFFFFFFNFLNYLFIYLFLAVLGLHFCARAFSICGKWGLLFIAVRGPLTIAASPVAEHRLQTRRLSSWGSRAQLLRGMWDLPRPRLEPVSPALAGRLSTTAPPGKPPSKPFWTGWLMLLSRRKIGLLSHTQAKKTMSRT